MAKTISQLPDATVVNGSDELIIQQSGVTKRATKTEVLAGIVNANVDAAAAIAGTKISPNFGSQNVVTSGLIEVAANGEASILTGRASDNTSGPSIQLRKRRGTLASPTIVSSGDTCGTVLFYGHDGTQIVQSASITASIDATPGVNDMPGRLVFNTTADGSSTATERMRIDCSGNVGIGTSAPTARATISVGTANNDALSGAAGTVSIGNGAASGSVPSIVGNSADAQGIRIIGRTLDGNTASDVNIDARAVVGGTFTTLTSSAIRFSTNGVALMDILRNGSVGIGTSAPNAAARLDVSSTTQGFLPPRMTTAQRDAISTPPAGLMIYNTSTNVLNFYNGSAWGAV